MVIWMTKHFQISDEAVARYRELIQAIDMNERQKDDVIGIVYSIMRNFVDASFGIHPVQSASSGREFESSQIHSVCDNLPITQKTHKSVERAAPEFDKEAT